MRLFHGGIPGLRRGDLIEPGHERREHEGCAWCAARDQLPPALDGRSLRQDRIYLTPDRMYARFYASLWGRGDLYQVEAVGELERSTEDTIEAWTAPAARIIAVMDRAVRLTMSERRRLWREWTAADQRAIAHETGTVIPLKTHTNPTETP